MPADPMVQGGTEESNAMSDVSQGPDWWQALDGKWHPPLSNQGGGAFMATTMGPTVPSATGGAYLATQASPPRGSLLDSPASAAPFGDFSVGTKTPGRQLPRRFSPIWLVVVAILLVAVGGTTYALMGSSQNAVVGLSARQVLAQATAAATKEGSVHVVSTIQVAGQTATYVNDTGATSGEQQITATGGIHMTALLVNGVAYIRANVQAFTTLFQVTNAVAQRFANIWLSFGLSDPAFHGIAATLTLGSLVQQDFPASGLTKLGASDINGHSVIGVRGQLGGGIPGALFVSTGGTPLPVEVKSSHRGATTTAVFSGWGEAVRVSAPSGAVSGSSFEAQLTPSPSQADRAAESNLTNALTEVKALYQNTQSYTPNGAPMTVGEVESQAPEFSWTTAACGPASPSNCVSMQVVDASAPGDGQAMVLGVYSEGSGDCWYGLDLEIPASSFTDAGQNVAIATRGRTPTGIGTPGVFYAEKSPTPSASASTYCSATWAATQATFGWGVSYSSPGAAG
jgi:hypothetical protein